MPAQASAARFAIGIQKGADERAVAREVQAVTGEPVTKIGPFALSVRARHAGELLSLNGTSWVERMRATRRLAFTPNDPLISRQWYLGRIHAFDAWPQLPDAREHVRVAVLDSGDRLGPPGPPGPDRRRAELRLELVGDRYERPRHLRRRRDRSRD